MNVEQICVTFDIIEEPIKNAVDIKSYKSRQEIERIIRIFDIAKNEKVRNFNTIANMQIELVKSCN